MSSGNPAGSRQKILVTGVAGGLARLVVSLLARKYELVGVDPRALPPGRDFPGEFFQIDYRQRKMTEVFRNHKFDALIHLGRLPVTAPLGRSARYQVNVLGTRNLLDLAHKYEVPQTIVFSTFHVYGAHQHNHLYITEDEPLRASQTFPEIIDVVELDHSATTFLLKNPNLHTTILRPVNIIGPNIQNQMCQMLRQEYCPFLLGYDPLQQFIHESDVARALELCLEKPRNGVYNLAGEGVVPFSQAIRLAGTKPIPVPPLVAYPMIDLLNRTRVAFPRHLLDYFKYPTVVSDESFRRDFDYSPSVSTVDALSELRAGRFSAAQAMRSGAPRAP